LYLLLTLRPHTPTLFPYTTLFRSQQDRAPAEESVEAREKNVEIVARQELEILARRPGRKKAPKQHLINRQLGRESHQHAGQERQDRKSTRLNSSHVAISYAVFCLK